MLSTRGTGFRRLGESTISKVGSSVFEQVKPDDQNFIGYFEKNQNDFRNRLNRSDLRQKSIYEQQVSADVKSHALAQSEREKALILLAKKSGFNGERFTNDDMKRIQESNSKYYRNGKANVEIALQRKKTLTMKDEDELRKD